MQKVFDSPITVLAIGVALAMVLIFLASCDRADRHEALTFFFDGVPALESEGGPGAPIDADVQAGPAALTGGWFVHEPLDDCTNCHSARRQRTFSRQVRLVAEVPDLCYRCHRQDTPQDGWVHGPVAAGECLLCHEPHKTRVQFLLRKAAPDLCYDCHNREAVEMVDHHDEASYADCLTCHEGHVGRTRSLLRPAVPQEQTDGGDPFRTPRGSHRMPRNRLGAEPSPDETVLDRRASVGGSEGQRLGRGILE